MSFSFLCDSRLQSLSFQARDLLKCIEEAFERYPYFSDEHGRAPADPVLLRNFIYPHRPDIRHTHVARWFSELESAFAVTVFESDRGRVFELAHGRQSLPRILQPETSSPEVIPVIHKSARDPPDFDQINNAVAAAASFNDLDLIFETMKRFFPLLDLMAEYRKYHRQRLAEKKPAIAAHPNPRMLTFVKWCSQAAVPMPPPPVKRIVEETPRPIPMPDLDDDQPDLFAELAHKRFLAELEARKLRNKKQQSERKIE
jgi:hypothetical protein